jgi:hypothetical protein
MTKHNLHHFATSLLRLKSTLSIAQPTISQSTASPSCLSLLRGFFSSYGHSRRSLKHSSTLEAGYLLDSSLSINESFTLQMHALNHGSLLIQTHNLRTSILSWPLPVLQPLNPCTAPFASTVFGSAIRLTPQTSPLYCSCYSQLGFSTTLVFTSTLVFSLQLNSEFDSTTAVDFSHRFQHSLQPCNCPLKFKSVFGFNATVGFRPAFVFSSAVAFNLQP